MQALRRGKPPGIIVRVRITVAYGDGNFKGLHCNRQRGKYLVPGDMKRLDTGPA
jgi:hypothetical protein